MKRLIVLIVICWSISPAIAFGNGVAVKEVPGNMVIPTENNEIRLDKVVVRMKGQHLVTSFAFVNTSSRQIDIKMGFPFVRDTEPKEFFVKIDGGEARVEKKTATENQKLRIGAEYEFLYVWPIHFRPREKKAVECRYDIQWVDDLGLSRSFTYITKTGALWKDTIKQADIVIELDDDAYRLLRSKDYSFTISPGGYKIKKKMIEWHFTDWKPHEDISISFDKILKYGDPSVVEEIAGLLQFKEEYEGDVKYYRTEDLEDKRVATDGIHDKFYVKVLRNEIFARHGRTFKSKNLQYVFNNQSWYKPNPKYSDKLLNEYEVKNIEFILEYERKKGWR